MESTNFLFSTILFLFLIFSSCFTYLLSKKIKIPYTVLLVFVGILLYPLSKIHFFGFINNFGLNPDILFYILLPILLFEAAYNINIKNLIKTWKTISLLAILGIILSVFFIGFFLFYIFNGIGLHIPLLVTLLFGSIISATDPVAVLSIFKSIGAPKRLILIFEGESLFNDGTAVAIFTVILSVMLSGNKVGLNTLSNGIILFISMIFTGIILGLLLGIIFSKIFEKINYNEKVEILILLLSAYVSFTMAELLTHNFPFLPISPIITTVISSLVLGNYGKYKITPKSELVMNKFLEFFTFISNSIIFILMGIILFSININLKNLIFPILITIIIVLLARAISIYFSIKLVNGFKLEENINDEWQKLLFWGGLRGALALIMVLMIPGIGEIGYENLLLFQESIGWHYEYNIKEFLLVLTVGIIFFTTFINTPTITYVIKKMGINKLYNYEKIEFEEWKIISTLNILKKINKLNKNEEINIKEYEKLKIKYKKILEKDINQLKNYININKGDEQLFIRRLMQKYALGIEKSYLENFYYNKNLNEKQLKFLLIEIENNINEINFLLKGKNSIKSIKNYFTWFDKNNLFKKKYSKIDMYIIHRTKYELSKKVIKYLEKVPSEHFGFDNNIIDYIISRYKENAERSNKKRKELLLNNKNIILLEEEILKKYFLRNEEKILKDFFDKGAIPLKYYSKMIKNIDNKLYSDLEYKEEKQ